LRHSSFDRQASRCYSSHRENVKKYMASAVLLGSPRFWRPRPTLLHRLDLKNISHCVMIALWALSVLVPAQTGFARTAYYSDTNDTGSEGTTWAGAYWSTNANGSSAPLSVPTSGNTYSLIWNGTPPGATGTYTDLRGPYSTTTTVPFPGTVPPEPRAVLPAPRAPAL
jgi:hypothetical protein